jgi:gliding motility-associated-like protein
LLEFSFDNKRGVLYALNWRTSPANAPVFTVSQSSSPVCTGQPDTITATLSSAQNVNAWQWQLNGQPVGGNSPVYTDANPIDSDVVTCSVLITTACGTAEYTSQPIVLTVSDSGSAAIRISSSANGVCQGDPVQFKAVVVNGGATPVYQWMVNGAPAGGDSSGFTTTFFNHIDSIRCLLGNAAACGSHTPVASNQLIITTGKCIPLVMPNAFTPNGDGNNDVFRIPPSVSIPLSRFTIFDRWGQQVFTTRDAGVGWNGTFGGRPAIAGVYVWVIETVDPPTGERSVYKGTVILVR